MEDLHENAERIWKVLSQFSEGTTARRLQQITAMSKTATYDALNELSTKGFIVNEKKKWKIIQKPSQENAKSSRLGFFDYLKNRREAKQIEEENHRRELLIKRDTYFKLVAKFYPELGAFKDWADIEKETREEYKKKRTNADEKVP